MPPVATSQSHDVAVIGGGPIGLACAWRAAGRGLRTVVLDAGEPGAWQVAAGMLAPVTEAEFGERALLELGLRSARAYEHFCAELAAASERDPGHRRSGTLVVARDGDEAEERAGAELRPRTRASGVSVKAERVTGVALADGTVVPAGIVVVAAGVH